jgi:hypothetical protein
MEIINTQLKIKWSLLKNLSDRCFLIHMVLFKIILFCDLTVIQSVLLWFVLFSSTALNEKFHLWFTDMHYKFLFSYKGSNVLYRTYLFCLEARSFFEHRGSKLFIFVSVFFIAATVSAGILDSSSIEYTKSTWFVLIISFMLRTYFKTVLVPIFHPVRFSSNPLESGRWQIKHFHSSRSLHMPFGGAGKEFMKSIGKFALAYPKTTFLLGGVGFSVPLSQYMVNVQTSFDLEHQGAKIRQIEDSLYRRGSAYKGECGPGSSPESPLCESFKKIYDLSVEALEKTM